MITFFHTRSTRSNLLFIATLLFLSSLPFLASADEVTNYKDGDPIPVFADKMSPVANPYETYDFTEAPGCPLLPSKESLTLGELLAGDRGYLLQTNILFAHSSESAALCTFAPTAEDVEKLKSYIKGDYNYELFVDGLPVWGAFGQFDAEKAEYYIFLHRQFHIGVNGDRIVNVTLETLSPAPLKEGQAYQFTYSVRFEASSVAYANRFSTVFEARHVGSRTRLISVINSVLIIFFLLCVIMLILTRALRSDYAKMEQESQMGFDGQDIIDESGWRCLYADVFRVPRHTGLFCGLLGCGTQLLVMITLAIGLSVMSNYRISMNHNLITYTVLGYVFTSAIAGYVSGYQFMGCGLLAPPMATKWIRAFHVAFLILPATYAIGFVPSAVAAVLVSSAQLPYLSGVLYVLSLWAFIAYPLCLGGVLCSRYLFRRTERRRNLPHINQIPRLVPRPHRKLLTPRALLVASGVLPFMAIFVEFSFLFTSLWSFKLFHLYGFLTITTVLYVAVTACVCVVATYLLLTTENHYWKWLSIGFGASCSGYVFLYAVYFYFFKSSMYGLFMWIVYFSYSMTFSLLLAIVGGTVGYFASSFFVKRIYGQVKHD